MGIKDLKKHQFKKGAPSANPHGARAHDPVMKNLKNIGRAQFSEIIEVALKWDTNALEEYSKNKKLSVIQMGVVRCLLKASIKGEWNVFKDIVEQLVGKNPDVIKVTTTNTTTLNAAVAQVTDDELRKRIEKIRSDV